jgi:hypothetical protein
MPLLTMNDTPRELHPGMLAHIEDASRTGAGREPATGELTGRIKGMDRWGFLYPQLRQNASESLVAGSFQKAAPDRP